MEINQNKEQISESEKFEINDYEFRQVDTSGDRIVAIGKKWTRFELLYSFIGAVWMEKWRRFGVKLLAIGILLLGVPLYMFPLVGESSIFIFILMMIFSVPGIIVILIWALVKREALLLYTPGGTFKIEGSSQFVEKLWKIVSPKIG